MGVFKIKKFVVVVTQTVQAGYYTEMKNFMIDLAKKVRAEKGCLQFDLVQDIKNENNFIIYEIWENKDAWENHLQTTHINEYNLKIQECLEKMEINCAKFVEI